MAITTLQEYVSATESALFNNPPRNSPAYADDPIRMWRYYMRNFGAGLAYFDETKTHGIVSGLYSGWFMRLEFNSNRPDVNAKEFFEWIHSAEREMRAHLTQRAPDVWWASASRTVLPAPATIRR